jgi:hypothetical protein
VNGRISGVIVVCIAGATALNFLVQACGTALLTFAVGTLACGCIRRRQSGVTAAAHHAEGICGGRCRQGGGADGGNQSALFALAPAMLGAVRDIASSYIWSFAHAAAIQLVSAGIILIRRS